MSRLRLLVAVFVSGVLLTQSMAAAAMPMSRADAAPVPGQASAMPCHGDASTSTEAAAGETCCLTDGCACAALCAGSVLPVAASGNDPAPDSALQPRAASDSTAAAWRLTPLRPPITLSV